MLFFSLLSFCFRYITKQTAFAQCDKPTSTVYSVGIFHRPVKQLSWEWIDSRPQAKFHLEPIQLGPINKVALKLGDRSCP